MQKQYEAMAKELMRLTLEEATPSEIRAKAMEIKQAITDHYLGLWRWLNLADNLANIYAPDPNWRYGMLLETSPVVSQAAPEQPRSRRAERVFTIARGMVAEGAKTVTARAIAEQLSREGELGSLKDLATSAGNHLARSKEWRRVKPGEYAPAGQEV